MMKMSKIINYVFIISLLLTLSGCIGNNKKNCISVSILPVKYFVDRLTDESVKVNVMLPSGADHDSYSPTPMQLKELSDSRLYIKIGYLGYELSWDNRFEELNKEMKVLNLSDNIDLIHNEDIVHGNHSHEGGIDPHIWMSPKIMRNLVPQIKDAIIASFPELKEKVEKNYAILKEDLEKLDIEYTQMTEVIKNRKFMIFHPALTYLARDYGFEQISIEFEGKEPSIARLAEIVERSKNEDIKVIFIQAEYDKRNAELIAKETDASLIDINPMAYDWLSSMNDIRNMILLYLK